MTQRTGKTPGAKRAKPAKRASIAKKAPRRKAELHPPARLIDGAEALAEATQLLLARDPDFIGRLIALAGHPPLRRQEPGFAGMVGIIVSQQVSVASAAAILKRVGDNLAPLSAERLLEADDAALRACGLSGPKMRALRAFAHAVHRDGLDLPGLAALEAEAAHRALTTVKGIGPWTADIYLLFHLGHPDAFPSGDLALQEAARLAMGLKTRPDAKRLEKLAERWRPVRGIAARLLWAYYRVVKQRAGVGLEADA